MFNVQWLLDAPLNFNSATRLYFSDCFESQYKERLFLYAA